MHPNETVNLCINDKERRLRELLTWLNTQGSDWFIEYVEPEPIDYSDMDFSIRGDGKFMSQSFRRRENIFYLSVDKETATLMKLFFEDYEHIPEPEPEPEETVEIEVVMEPENDPEITYIVEMERAGEERTLGTMIAGLFGFRRSPSD